MRKFIVLIALLYSIQVTTQDIKYDNFSTQLNTSKSANLFQNSDFVDNLIKDKQIILLGELDHGDGSSFEVKTKIIKYLHENHGFNKLVFESGIIDCAELWKSTIAGKSVSELAKKHLYYIWGQVQETQELFRYIASEFDNGTPIEIVGIDPQFSGTRNESVFLEILKHNLDRHEINSSKFEELSYELEIISHWMNFPSKKDHRISEATFNAHLDYFKDKVLSNESETETDLMSLYFENIKTLAAIKWERREGSFELRDQQMFRNLKFLKGKNEKIIVWAANAHIIRNDDQLKGKDSDYNIIGIEKLGDHVFREFPQQMFSIGFASNSGKTLNFMNKNKTTKISKNKANSLEDKLKGLSCGFVDLKRFEKSLNLSLYESQLFYPNVKCIARWSNHFDAAIFIREMKPSTPLW